jgi:hypothetical protein
MSNLCSNCVTNSSDLLKCGFGIKCTTRCLSLRVSDIASPTSFVVSTLQLSSSLNQMYTNSASSTNPSHIVCLDLDLKPLIK